MLASGASTPGTGVASTPAPVRQTPLASKRALPAIAIGAASSVPAPATATLALPGVTVTCPASGGPCRVVVALRLTLALPAGGVAASRTMLVRAVLAPHAGWSGPLRVALSSQVRRALARGGRMSVRATITATNAAGSVTKAKPFAILVRAQGAQPGRARRPRFTA